MAYGTTRATVAAATTPSNWPYGARNVHRRPLVAAEGAVRVMGDGEAIAALVGDLHWQIEQLKPRGIKNNIGQPYNPSYYKRGLRNAVDRGGLGVAEYVRG